jgi:hypothetical protein
MTRTGAVILGAVMLGTAAGLVPAAWPGAVAGAIALGFAVPGMWPAAPTVAACAAVVTTGIGIAAGMVPLIGAAAEGTLVLAYLLTADLAGARLAGSGQGWASTGVPVVAGAAAAAACALAAATKVPASPWLTTIGVAAAGAALITASGARPTGDPGQVAGIGSAERGDQGEHGEHGDERGQQVSAAGSEPPGPP